MRGYFIYTIFGIELSVRESGNNEQFCKNAEQLYLNVIQY